MGLLLPRSFHACRLGRDDDVTIEDPADPPLQGFQVIGFRFNPDGPFTTISIDESLQL